MSRLAISLLGPYWVTVDDQAFAGFATDKVRALLAYLAVEAERSHRREALATLLWLDYSETAARTNLRQALYRLRCALGDRQASLPHLLVTFKEVQLNPAADHWLDVSEFEAHIRTCRARHPGDQSLCPDCVARLKTAVELYRGDFLSGFSLPDCPRFDWWQLSTEEACHRQALEALTWLTDHYEAHREYAWLGHYARRKIELEPWRESAHRRLMRALALRGERGQALHQYEICRRALAQQLGVEPSAATTQLCEQIREGALDMRVHEKAATEFPAQTCTPPRRETGHRPGYRHRGAPEMSRTKSGAEATDRSVSPAPQARHWARRACCSAYGRRSCGTVTVADASVQFPQASVTR